MSASQANTPPPLNSRVVGQGRWRFAGVFALIGAVGALGHPPLAWPIFTFLSLVVVVTLAPWTFAPRRAAWAGWAYGAGYFAVTLHWIVEPFLVDIARHGWMAPFAIVLMAGGLALFWSAAFAIAARRQSGLVFALAFSAAELLRAHLFTGFPWGMHVTAFVDVWLYQSAAFLGPHGLTLALILAIVGASSLPRFWAPGAIGALAALSLGSLPAPEVPAPDAPVIRVVQPNARQDLKWRADMMPVFMNRQFEATEADPKADLVIWPEVALLAWLEEGAEFYEEAARRGGGAELLIGANSFRNGQAYNALAHIGAEGQISALYDKWHLVPFGEFMPLPGLFARIGIYGLHPHEGFGFAAGSGPDTMSVPGIGVVQPLICYESIFAHEVGRGVERPRLITVVTNDAWFGKLGGPAQHLAQSQARAIEQGVPVARSANTGISAIIDARGRIVTSLPLGLAGHVDAPLPDALPPTLYAQLGDWPFFALFALVLLGHLFRHRSNTD